jgi:hypothetical protein
MHQLDGVHMLELGLHSPVLKTLVQPSACQQLALQLMPHHTLVNAALVLLMHGSTVLTCSLKLAVDLLYQAF